MGKNYKVSTELTVKDKGFTSGMKSASKSTLNLSKTLKDTIKNVTGLSLGLTGAIKVVKDVSKFINESTVAYKDQAISIQALQTAMNNNPLTNGQSTKALTDFAAEIQKTTNYGDDYLIPFMTELIASGRSEAETMKIIKTATDLASSGAMSFETAIQQLNATMNGNIGRLGQQNAELRNLTDEELKNGKAVDILAEKYKGLAQSTVDTSKQLQNLKSDFKEAVGEFTAPSSELWNKFWLGFYENGIKAIQQIDAFLDAEIIGKKQVKELTKFIKKSSDLAKVKETLGDFTQQELLATQKYLSFQKKKNDNEKLLEKLIESELSKREQNADYLKKEAEAEEQRKRLQEERNKKLEEEKRLRQELLQQEIKNNRQAYEYQKKVKEEQKDAESQRLMNNLRDREQQKEAEKTARELTLSIAQAVSDGFKSGFTNGLKELASQIGSKNGYSSSEIGIAISGVTTVITEAMNEDFMFGIKLVKKYGEAIKKTASVIKTSLTSLKSVLEKTISFSIDDSLDALLQFEDNILTFFSQTVPQLPRYVSSALNSIKRTLSEVNRILDINYISSIVNNMLNSLSNNLPQIISNFVDIAVKIVKGIIAGITKWIESGGWQKLLDGVMSGLKKVMDFMSSNAGRVVSSIKSALPALINFIKEAIKLIASNFAQIQPALTELVNELAKATAIILGDPQIVKAIASMGATFIKVFSSSWKTFFETFFETIKPSWISDLESLLTWKDTNNDGSLEWQGAKTIKETGDKIKSGFEKIGDWFKGLGKHAIGSNNVKAGLSLVGERGAELIDFRGGERVYNASNTKKILGGMSGNANTFNVTFENVNDTSVYKLMKELKNYNKNMAINGVL